MSDVSDRPLSVYRLLPVTPEDARTLTFDDSVTGLVRWQLNGSPEDLPEVVGAQWRDKERPRALDFPVGRAEAPVLSRRLTGLLGEERLLRAGRLLPLRIDGEDQDEYRVYAVEHVADCLDPEASSPPVGPVGRIKSSVFRPEAIPADLPAFRVPQLPTMVQWNGWAATALADLLGPELQLRLVWSQDPARTPHHDPWGF